MAVVYPKFAMVDGIDKSGKSAIIAAFLHWAESQGMKVVDLPHLWGELDANQRPKLTTIPLLKDIEPVDLIISAEPTYTAIGKVIREEVISEHHPRPYSALATAHAYALDRNMLYNRLLIDALVQGKYVVQDRGFVTSIVYQSVQGEQEGLKLDDILALPGNALALEHMPGLLVVPRIDPGLAAQRGDTRAKQDHAIFERLEFQRKIAEAYASGWLREFFERRGTAVAYLDMAKLPTPADTAAKTVEVWETYLRGKGLL
jgi:thymidylate kinase